jgi:hypothetical protein
MKPRSKAVADDLVRITFPDGRWCVCRRQDIADIACGLGPNEYAVEDVEMTRAQFEALPEFEG